MLKYDYKKQLFRRGRERSGVLLAGVSLGRFVNRVVYLQSHNDFLPVRLAVHHFSYKGYGAPFHFCLRAYG